jgi:hypothetical protein
MPFRVRSGDVPRTLVLSHAPPSPCALDPLESSYRTLTDSEQ